MVMAFCRKPAFAYSFLLLGVLLAMLQFSGVEAIGVCYGLNGDNLPSRRDVVSLYKARNIGAMRLYAPDREALQALRGSNIELIVDVPGESLQSIASDAGAASRWVQDNIRNYYPDVRFKYVAVGNEVNPGAAPFARLILPAMRNIHNALASAGFQDQIKVSTAVWSALLTDTYPPSNGKFNDNFRWYIDPIISFLASNGSPLLANIYPYFSYTGNTRDIPLDYALFRSSGTPVHDPNGLRYQNLFDALVDSMHAALSKAGGANVPIVISETGWPSSGHPAATPDNAATYLRNLVNHVQKGTPRKPQPLETYIFAMFDENLKPGEATERHFGLFYPHVEAKYDGIV
uniref:Glucan endo-1,3-beta-D-glucosidase n=1 Tax=Kalanchoe fedtschenkoi TaxID=63787 RepID=A0A7N0TIE5_KALFE